EVCEDLDIDLEVLELCRFTRVTSCDGYTERLFVLAVDACGQIELESTVSWLDFVQNLVVVNLTWNSNRTGEREVGCIGRNDGAVNPLQTLALNAALVIQLWSVKKFEQHANDRAVVAVVRPP